MSAGKELGVVWSGRRFVSSVRSLQVTLVRPSIEYGFRFVIVRKGKHCSDTCKAVPLQAWSGPEGSRKRFRDNGTERWQGCQTYAPVAFTPRKFTWYSFLSEAESTPGS